MLLRNHILSRWGSTAIGDISALAVTDWLKQLRRDYAAATVATIRAVFSMMLDDAVDERLIATNPCRRRRRRGRHRDLSPGPRERVWAMSDHVVRIAAQARTLGGPSAGLLIITAAWTGCRWGELAGLQRHNVDLNRGTITIDPDVSALHESIYRLYLATQDPCVRPDNHSSPIPHSPPTRVPRPHDRVVRVHQPTGLPTPPQHLRPSRPAPRSRRRHPTRHLHHPPRPYLPRTSARHKTWLIADRIPEIAQARRLGHHLRNRLTEVHSHIAPEVEAHLLHAL